MSKKPIIFTTLGDAGGIGPELVAKSLNHPSATSGVRRLIVGPRVVFEQGLATAKVDCKIPITDSIDKALELNEDCIFVEFNPNDLQDPIQGESTATAGASDLEIAKLATDLFRRELIDGFVFAPVNKLSLKLGGSAFEGYKAFIADDLNVSSESAEINTIGYLWTTRVTSHIALEDVPKKITENNVYEIIRYFDRELKRFGYKNPKIAVSGLNPHNGDTGMFGRQEIDAIEPAVARSRNEKLNVSGPYPPDTVFLTAQKEKFLGVVSMYHDQGQIATKLLGFDEGVTYFGGLPFPITTPAHGTAYDIAGSGEASETPMVNALNLMCRAALTAKGIAV